MVPRVTTAAARRPARARLVREPLYLDVPPSVGRPFLLAGEIGSALSVKGNWQTWSGRHRSGVGQRVATRGTPVSAHQDGSGTHRKGGNGNHHTPEKWKRGPSHVPGRTDPSRTGDKAPAKPREWTCCARWRHTCFGPLLAPVKGHGFSGGGAGLYRYQLMLAYERMLLTSGNVPSGIALRTPCPSLMQAQGAPRRVSLPQSPMPCGLLSRLAPFGRPS